MIRLMFAMGRSGSGNMAEYMGWAERLVRSIEEEEVGVEVPCVVCGWYEAGVEWPEPGWSSAVAEAVGVEVDIVASLAATTATSG